MRAKVTQRKTYSIAKNEKLNPELEKLLTKLLLAELDFHDYSDSKKLQIYFEKLDYFKFFQELDNNGDGFLDIEDFDLFLRKRNIILYSDELLTLLLKYDADGDKKLNLEEYLRFIMPNRKLNTTDENLINKIISSYNFHYREQLFNQEKENLLLSRIKENKDNEFLFYYLGISIPL